MTGLGVGSELSSREMLALPFFREGGKNGSDDAGFDIDTASASSTAMSLLPSSLSLSPETKGTADGNAVEGREVLKTRPGLPPPPRTRSGAAGALTGTFCLGAGSIENSVDLPAPAPDSRRGFFAAGLKSSSSSSSTSLGRAGKSMAIFLVFLGLGAEEDDVAAALEVDSGGRANVDFFGGTGAVNVEVTFAG